MPRRRAWKPTPVFLPGESYGQKSVVGYSSGCQTELEMTKVTKHACMQPTFPPNSVYQMIGSPHIPPGFYVLWSHNHAPLDHQSYYPPTFFLCSSLTGLRANPQHAQPLSITGPLICCSLFLEGSFPRWLHECFLYRSQVSSEVTSQTEPL